jgi:hypothetical protein
MTSVLEKRKSPMSAWLPSTYSTRKLKARPILTYNSLVTAVEDVTGAADAMGAVDATAAEPAVTAAAVMVITGARA